MNAQSVRKSFNRAATSYAATAMLQQQVAAQLINDVSATLTPDFAGTVLDAGCGTGDALNQLHARYPQATFIGLDFAESMLQQLVAPHRTRCINANLEQLPIASDCIDLYASSLAWQWCDVSSAIREAARVLKPGGQLWLTTLVDGTFDELSEALAAAGLTPAAHLLPSVHRSDLTQAFDLSSLQPRVTRVDVRTTYHPDFAELRHSIRGVGANHLPDGAHEPISRAARQRLLDAYEARRTPQGLPLTYNVLTIHAQRT